MADIAGKQFRAEQLRQELTVLRVQHSSDMTEASQSAHEAKLDQEIAELEMQVAIETEKAKSGGSVIDAMEVMAAAAAAEVKAGVVIEPPVDSSDAKTEVDEVDVKSEEPVVVEESKPEETKVVVNTGLNLTGGNQ